MTHIAQIRMIFTREWLLAIGPGDVTATGQSFLLISVTGVVILLLCYRVYASSKGSGHGTTGNKMEPEVVKEKTERWSEEAEINPAFPPGESPKNTVASCPLWLKRPIADT